ncbi:MAG: hypothetical protein KDK70_35710, partial [Myxococcales bacterium]|nr:hypothetical protein [Myxococcales bacterium]
MRGSCQIAGSMSVLALLALCSACAGHPPPPRGAAPATMTAGPLPHGPAEPGGGLPVPSLDVAWAPPMLVAGDLAPLREALARHASVAMHLGDRLSGPEGTERAVAMVQALRPGAAVTALEVA